MQDRIHFIIGRRRRQPTNPYLLGRTTARPMRFLAGGGLGASHRTLDAARKQESWAMEDMKGVQVV